MTSGHHQAIATIDRLTDVVEHAGAGADELFSSDVVVHYCNPELSDLDGDYRGVPAVKEFCARLQEAAGGAFEIEPVSVVECGDELSVSHGKIKLALGDTPVEIDSVVAWRVAGDRIAEVWNIPAVGSAHALSN